MAYIPDNYINVKHYGAVGDGVTNDRAAINLAVTAASARNSTLYFPDGTYIVNGLGGSPAYASIELSSPIIIFGDGAIIRNTTSTVNPLTTFGILSADVTIEGITIHHTVAIVSSASIRAFEGSDNLTLRNISITAGSDWGVFIQKSIGVRVENCVLVNNGTAHAIEVNTCSDVRILNNKVFSSDRTVCGNGIEVFHNLTTFPGSTCENHFISGNYIDNVNNGIITVGGNNTTIHDNHIFEAYGHGIGVINIDTGPDPYSNVVVSSNTIDTVGGNGQNSGIVTGNNVFNVVIQNNTITNVDGSDGVSGDGDGIFNASISAIICGNQIRDCWTNGINNSASYVEIEGNTIEDVSGIGVGSRRGIINTSDYTNISHNSVRDTRGGSARMEGILNNTGSDGCTIQGNIVRDTVNTEIACLGNMTIFEGYIKTAAHPNSITGLSEAQDGNPLLAWDQTNNIVYAYDRTNTAGSRWYALHNVWVKNGAAAEARFDTMNFLPANGSDNGRVTMDRVGGGRLYLYNSAGTVTAIIHSGEASILLGIKLTNLSTFVDEAAAVVGGLAQNTVYKTATGELRIKL